MTTQVGQAPPEQAVEGDDRVLDALVDILARGAMAAQRIGRRVALDAGASGLARAEAERLRRVEAIALADPACARAETLPAVIAEVAALGNATLALEVPSGLTVLACHGLNAGLEEVPLLPATATLPPEQIAALIEAFINALRAALAELPPAERARLAAIIASLEGLLTVIRTGGVRLTLAALQGYLEPILLRLLQLCNRLPPSLVRLLWGPAVALLDGLAGLGAATAPLLVKLLVAAAGLAIGVLIGWLILKIPTSDGRTVWEAIEDSWLTDLFWWVYREWTDLDACEARYARYVRMRELRREAQRTGAAQPQIEAAVTAEIQVLEEYLPCVPEANRGTYQRELARLRALLGQ